MNKDAQAVFLEYFGSINLLHDGLAWFLFFLLGIAWMIIIVKRFRERITDKENDGDVFSVMLRGLAMLLIVVAFLMSS